VPGTDNTPGAGVFVVLDKMDGYDDPVARPRHRFDSIRFDWGPSRFDTLLSPPASSPLEVVRSGIGRKIETTNLRKLILYIVLESDSIIALNRNETNRIIPTGLPWVACWLHARRPLFARGAQRAEAFVPLRRRSYCYILCTLYDGLISTHCLGVIGTDYYNYF